MFKNYLKIALRNLLRNKTFSLINIIGLAIGMACCLLILFWIIDEMNYEKVHEKRDRIYRIACELNLGGRTDQLAPLMPPLAPLAKEGIPEIENSVRFGLSPQRSSIIEYEDIRYTEENLYFVDQSVFDIFTFPLVAGDPVTALELPFSMVITEDIAQKYYGDENPVGKTLLYEDKYTFTVTGVLKNIPRHTQLQSELMASYSSLTEINGPIEHQWGRFGNTYTYILLKENTTPEGLEAKLTEIIKTNAGERLASMVGFIIQPLPDIYLRSNLTMELTPTGNIDYVYLFSFLAVLILMIASINFMNMSTSKSAHRSREVGMRRVLGAFRFQLIKQFLGESILISLIALALALIIFYLGLPLFGQILEKELSISFISSGLIFIILIAFTVIVGILAGLYPAFFLSGFNTINTLKGKTTGISKSILRKGLVIFQFAISISLIVCTLVIYKQLNYTMNKNLGFDKEALITIPMQNPEIKQKAQALVNTFKNNVFVDNVSSAFSAPARGMIMRMGVRAEGIPEDDPLIMQALGVDYSYINTLGIQLIDGREFSEEFGSDATNAVILNQAAVKRLGWKNPIGKEFQVPNPRTHSFNDYKVIGIVRDFHMESLHNKISPLFMFIDKNRVNVLSLRMKESTQEAIASITESWKSVVPDAPFNYNFIDDDFARFYRTEQKIGKIIITFSLFAVLIACLGIFGLVTYTAERRNKEIGIRKVLGASVTGLSYLLSKEFLILVAISNIIGWPVAWYTMNRWLEGFAYKTEVSIMIYLIAGLGVMIIAILTVIGQSVRAAVSNPIDVIKYE